MDTNNNLNLFGMTLSADSFIDGALDFSEDVLGVDPESLEYDKAVRVCMCEMIHIIERRLTPFIVQLIHFLDSEGFSVSRTFLLQESVKRLDIRSWVNHFLYLYDEKEKLLSEITDEDEKLLLDFEESHLIEEEIVEGIDYLFEEAQDITIWLAEKLTGLKIRYEKIR